MHPSRTTSFLVSSVLIVFSALLIHFTSAQPAPRNGVGTDRLNPIDAGSSKGAARSGRRCSKRYREFDGTCTNDKTRSAGSASTALFSYFRTLSSKDPVGKDLPSTRLISNIVSSQKSDMPNRRRLSEFIVFFGQFLDHTIVATTTDENDEMNIPIPPDDSIMANFSKGTLSFNRNVRAIAVPKDIDTSTTAFDIERHINTLSSAIDLATVYGPDKERADALRTFEDGQMMTTTGNLPPYNTRGFFNSPSNSDRFFLAGDHRANEHPNLLAFHILFLREHNKLASELKATFKNWKDNKLYQMARKINIAQFQKIVYEEFYPLMTGRSFKPYRRYRMNVNPTVSITFSTAAFRLGHTMVGEKVTVRGPGMQVLPDIPAAIMFFNPQTVIDQGIDVFLRGAIYKRAQEVDVQVVDTLRNFLFQNVPDETGFDLIALNLQRGRDAGLPPYNQIRKFFIGKSAKSFADITSDQNVQSKLLNAYGDVDKVEAWIGLLAEDHISGGSMGPTVFKIWERELKRLRDGDRFFYKAKNLFPRRVMRKFKRLQEIYNSNDLMTQILLRNTEITKEEIGRSAWYGQD